MKCGGVLRLSFDFGFIFEETVRGEEGFHAADGIFVGGIIAAAVVEEAVGLVGITDELAGVVLGVHFFSEELNGLVGDGGVGHAVEDDGGGGIFADIVIRREAFKFDAHAFGEVGDAFVIHGAPFGGGEHHGGIEEGQCVGHGGDFVVFVFFVKAFDGGDGGGEVAPGGTAARGDAVGIDAE